MLSALVDAGVTPDLVVGTSIGAINGAVIAARPGPKGVDELERVWAGVEESGLLNDGMVDRLRNLRRTKVSLHSTGQLEEILVHGLGMETLIEELATPFACVAACIETAGPEWFDRGRLIPALLASSAVPGLLEPVEIAGRHYLDGGLVDSIPLQRAVESGARTVFVLQVGRIESELTIPTNPLQVAQVSFEIARRHRFTSVMRSLPEGVTVHLLPSGGGAPDATDLRGNLRYRDLSGMAERIDRAAAASARYLKELA
jgi:NTE family protein